MEHREDGAADVRFVQATSGTWYDTSHTSWETDKSLLSRIMVAGGGGGANTRCSYGEGFYYGYGTGGAGGGLVGGSGTTEGQNDLGLEYPHSYGTGGTQTEGGHTRIFQNETITWENITAYFGNATYEGNDIIIERYKSSFAIWWRPEDIMQEDTQLMEAEAGGSSYISGYTGCIDHSSGYKFTNGVMTQGENAGDGYAIITFLGE